MKTATPDTPPAAASREKPWTWPIRPLRRWLARRKAHRRARRMREALLHTRTFLLLWRDTTSIANQDRERLTARFRRACYARYRRDFVAGRLGILFLLAVQVLFVVYFALLPVALQGYEAGGYLNTLVLALLGSYLALVGLLLIPSWISSYLGMRWRLIRRVGGTFNLVMSCAVSAPVVYLTARHSAHPLFVVTLGLLYWPFLYAAIVAPLWAALSMARYAARGRDPDSAMASALFSALLLLERQSRKWPDLKFRASVARHVSESGKIARSFLLRKFDIADPATLLWATRRAEAIAAAFTEKQRWLMTPKPDTRDVLLVFLSRSIVAVLDGAWDELDRVDPAADTVSQDAGAAPFGKRSAPDWAFYAASP